MDPLILRKFADDFGADLKDDQFDKFVSFYEILVRENEVMNLTAITDFEEVQEKHFLDSLALASVTDLNSYVNLIDVGTGAGFPGMPLAIAFPKLKVTLMDALQKRTDFLERAAKIANIENVSVIHARSEELAHNAVYREKFDIVVSRAVAALPVLCEYCLPYTKVGGFFAAYKGKNSDEEIADAENAIKELGGKIKEIRKFTLPLSEGERAIILIEKIEPTPEKYPRRQAKIARKPL